MNAISMVLLLFLASACACADSLDFLHTPVIARLSEDLTPVLQSIGATNACPPSDSIWVEYHTTNGLPGSDRKQIIPQVDGFHLVAVVLGGRRDAERHWKGPIVEDKGYGTHWSHKFQDTSRRLISVHLSYGPQMDTNVIAKIEGIVESIAISAMIQGSLSDINERVHNQAAQSTAPKVAEPGR
jgi:hypothetical protein